MGSEGHRVAVDGHCRGRAIQVHHWSVSAKVAGKRAAGGDRACCDVERVEGEETGGQGGIDEGLLAEVK